MVTKKVRAKTPGYELRLAVRMLTNARHGVREASSTLQFAEKRYLAAVAAYNEWKSNVGS